MRTRCTPPDPPPHTHRYPPTHPPTQLCNLQARGLELLQRPQPAVVELQDAVLGLGQGGQGVCV